MKTLSTRIGVAMSAMLVMLAAARTASAEVKVTISEMHICCKGCVSAIEKAASTVPGVKCTASTDNAETVLTADSKESLQKAVDEINKAGFYGTPDNKEIKIAAIKAPEGNVQKLEI